MILAKGRDGRIGRQIPGVGLQARVDRPVMGEVHGNLYLSESSIANEQANRRKKEGHLAMQKAAAQISAANRRQHGRLGSIRANAQIKASRQAVNFDPMNEKLKHHFARQKTMGQDMMVSNSLYHAPLWTRGTTGQVLTPVPPADFSNSGANMDTVPSGVPPEPVIWHTDFRTHMIKGNPLTRNGSYGPGVTDFDRFVNGRDVNDQAIDGGGNATEQIAGGTMLGRWNGGIAKRGILKRGHNNTLGDDSDFSDAEIEAAGSDDSGGFFSDLWDSASDTATAALPGLATQAIKPGSSSSTTTVIHTVPAATLAPSVVPGVPNWALYSGIGLLGVGVLFAVLKK